MVDTSTKHRLWVILQNTHGRNFHQTSIMEIPSNTDGQHFQKISIINKKFIEDPMFAISTKHKLLWVNVYS